MVELDFDKVKMLMACGYISSRRHPDLPLSILNYTAKTQYERHWSPETLQCRGLVVDDDYRIVARGFEKFFNYEEIAVLPEINDRFQECLRTDAHFKVTEKLDGSLILVFNYQGERVVASRGSFASEQAAKAVEILANIYPEFMPDPGLTYLFEIIYPENRIVVDYGKQEGLYLLAVLHTETGVECANLTGTAFPEPWVSEDFAGFQDIINYPQRSNAEGFVVTFYESELRVKIKWEEYKRLHRIVTGITPKHIWEELSAGRDLTDVLGVAPDEWQEWAIKVASDLHYQYGFILGYARTIVSAARLKGFTERKEYAEFFQHFDYRPILFLLLDGRDPDPAVWKLLKPAGGAFRCGEG